jgi:hypothetical protein
MANRCPGGDPESLGKKIYVFYKQCYEYKHLTYYSVTQVLRILKINDNLLFNLHTYCINPFWA